MLPTSTLDRLIARVLRVITAAGDQPLDKHQLERVVDGVLAETADLGDAEGQGIRLRLLHALREDDGRVYEILPTICSCAPGESACEEACVAGAIRTGPDGKAAIDQDACVQCGLCVCLCQSGAASGRSACLDLANLLGSASEGPVYAIVAPSFAGQFGPQATAESLHLALRRVGFTDVAEVALAADVTTVLEAQEYIERMGSDGKFMITSCCCPAFVKLVDKRRPNLRHLVSKSVSPMVACARMIKAREPGAKVVFIGPCLAKRAEARAPDFAGVVDLVLTFREMATIFEAAEIDAGADFSLRLAGFSDASHDGRIYARTGGVTEAISAAVRELKDDLSVVGVTGDGLKECASLLERIEQGGIEANFMEGMGCLGGCVGGPGTLIAREDGEKRANEFAAAASVIRASDNVRAHQWYAESNAAAPQGVAQRDPH